jgi:photosynthetic reaction center cytochrome c subunit
MFFRLFSQRQAFWIVFALVTLVLVGSSLGVVGWIALRLPGLGPQPSPAAAAAIYTDYDPDNPNLSPEAVQAMANYTAQFPQPQNVQILTGMDTAQISNYMVNQVSGGLKVNCNYCHNINDFASDESPNKAKARQMMQMVADLNQNWLTQLPASAGGKQVTCATCHNGQPVFATYPTDQSPLPDDFRLPLDDLDVLQITGKDDPSLDAVQLNQYTMSHMNASLGVGCAYCHNANWFPSNEKEEKGYALTMLQMAQHIDQQYAAIINNQSPSCYMCHRGAALPPGSANGIADVPAPLSSNPSARATP